MEGAVGSDLRMEHTALGSRASSGRPGSVRGIAGLRAPLVARERELAKLLTAAAGLAASRGQIVAVMGEAGLGESHLVAELRDALAASSQRPAVQWIEGRSLSYETTTPYAPFVGMLVHCLGIDAGGRGAAGVRVYDQILAQLDALFPGRGAEAAPFLATLLGIQPPGDHADRVKYLDPPTLCGMTFSHVAAFFERLAAERPLALFFDDVHWIDPTSLDLLLSLLPLTERAPLLIIAAFRPRQQEPSWQLHETAQRNFGPRYSALALQPLDLEQSRTLVAHLLYVEDLPEQVRRLILEKAEGNPFFVEEVIRSLLDAQLVVRDNGHWRATREIVHIAVPDTLNGIIAARLDRLDDRTHHIVQAAAVLGREFAHDILIDVCREPDWLDGALAELLRRDLVREKGPQRGRLYSFKHVLTQEAAYQSALLSKRREMHRRAAESMAARQGSTPSQPGEIARHFLEARFPAQALPYLVEAGDRAARAYSSTEAIGFYQQAIELRAAVEGAELVGRAYEGLGGVQAFANQIPEALDTYRAMLAVGEQAGDVALQISALNKPAGVTALRTGQFAEAEQYLARAEQLAPQHDEQSGVIETAIIRCQMCTAMADFDSVAKHMGELTAIGERIGSKEHQVMGLEHVASSLMFMARLDEAWPKAQEALRLAREIDDREHEAWVLCTTIPLCLLSQGDFDPARQALSEGPEVVTRIHATGAVIYGNWMLGELARWQGVYEDALLYGQRSLEAALPVEPFMPFMTVQPLGALGSAYLDISGHFGEQISQFHLHALRLLENPAGVGGGTAWADVGFCAMALGDLDIAEASFEKGLNVPTMFMRLERPRHLVGLALVRLHRGRPDEAISLVGEARAYLHEVGLRHLSPLVELVAGRIHVGSREFELALGCFQRAEAEALVLGMTPTAWQAQAGAAGALAALDQPAAAEEKRQAGQAVIDAIAARFRNATLRDSFHTSALARLAADAGPLTRNG